jgi:Na+-transporting methylmalonyl-CoA/oxaloacetate decarboxylase gamma subunit
MVNPLQLLRGANGVVFGAVIAISSALALLGYYVSKIGLETKYLLLIAGGFVFLLIILAAIYFIWKFIRKKNGDNMESELAREAAVKKQQRMQAKVAVQDIRDRWSEAMRTLQESKVKIYDLPWLLLIGEPQSGKTTTLRNSGLDFPVGNDSLSGSGGTVNCDWWFTNESVILDTAGRFTLPVDSAPDRQEWHAFLKMLRKYRPRCPINGVIVTIPATSLLEDSPETIRDKATKIHEKLHELVKILGVNFPVYIMVSKLDLVYGFAEFCGSLSSAERIQALGWNRKDIQSCGFKKDEYDSFFTVLASRLHFWSLRRLRDIPAGNEADRVYAFPLEFNRLKYPLASYFECIFRQDRFHVPLLLRGCHFSSGLQEGRSIAKALLGDPESNTPHGMIAEFAKSFIQSRAYFINVFYRKVFRERYLVTKAGKSTQREVILRMTAMAFAIVFFCGGSWLLHHGYRDMKNNVRPLEIHVKRAQSLLMSERGTITAENINEVIQVINNLEAGRQRIANAGAKRFLKGQGNTIYRDLGRIEDALIEQKLVGMIMHLVGESFSNISELSSPAVKEVYHNAMLQYLGYQSGNQISSGNIKDALNILPWQKQQLAEVHRDDIDRLIQGYPYGEDAGRLPRKVTDGRIQMRKGLGTLQKYWKSYYARLWNEQRDLFIQINTSYNDLLAMNINNGNDQVVVDFQQHLKKFIDTIDTLVANGEKQTIWSSALQDECMEDYFELDQSFSAKNLTDLAVLTPTVKRHSEVCNQLSTSIGNQWNTGLSKNSHILDNDGVVNPELLELRKALGIMLKFGPLMSPENIQKIKSNPRDPIALLNLWHAAWEEQRQAKFNEFENIIAPISAESWETDLLKELGNRYFSYLVWQADRQAVLTAMPVVLGENENISGSLKPGIDPPNLARASWLASRYQVLKELRDWLSSQHPGSNGIGPVQNLMSELMTSSWSNCLKYWLTTLQGVKPGTQILKTTSWHAFREEVIETRGMMLDPTIWPLDSFVDSMALDKIHAVKGVMKLAAENSLRTSNLRALEKRLEKTAYVFNATQFLPKLVDSQVAFLSCIEDMSNDSTQAWSTLKSGKVGSDTANISSFKSLSSFRKKIERDTISRGEMLTQRLTDIESHGLHLLRKEVAKDFDYEWRAFQNEWRPRLGNRFPFGEPEDWIDKAKNNGNLKTLNFKMASASDLHDFFFNQQKGFEAFVTRQGLSPGLLKNDDDTNFFLSDNQKVFLQSLFDWRDFLFNEKERPKTHEALMVLDTEQQSDVLDGTRLFTQMRFNGLETKDGKMLRVRFSGRKYKQDTFLWDLNAANEISIEAKNEETADSSTLHIAGGALALPVILAAGGNRNDSSDLSEWELTLPMPQPVNERITDTSNTITYTQSSSDFPRGVLDIPIERLNASLGQDFTYSQIAPKISHSEIYVPIKVKWDATMPDNIIWPVN